MRGCMMVIFEDGHKVITELDHVPTLNDLRTGVGGLIELIPYFDSIRHGDSVHPCIAYCNEEGKLHGMKFNLEATKDWAFALARNPMHGRGMLPDYLVGPIVVLWGDTEFMKHQ